MILSPLHLHLFHETYRGDRVVPQAMEEGALLDAYIAQLCDDLPGLARTLDDLGSLMLERREPTLPFDVADRWLANWRAACRSEQVIAKLDVIEELVAASVLMRPAEHSPVAGRETAVFTFSHQKLCERVLSRALKTRIAPRLRPTGTELLGWAKVAAGEGGGHFVELIGALEGLVVDLVGSADTEVVPGLLEIEDESVRTRVLGAALRALGPGWGLTVEGAPGPSAVLCAIVEHGLGSLPCGERLVALGTGPGRSLRRLGYSRAAEALDRGRLAIARSLVAEEPADPDRRRRLAMVLRSVAFMGRRSSRLEEARGQFVEAIEVMRSLLVERPDDEGFHRTLRSVLHDLGNLERDNGRPDEARRLFAEQLESAQLRLALDPTEPGLRRAVTVGLHNLGCVDLADGKLDDARGRFGACLEERHRLVEDHPSRINFRRDLAMALRDQGALNLAAGRFSEAVSCFRASADIRRELLRDEPYVVYERRQLSLTLASLAAAQLGSEDAAAARDAAMEAATISQSLADAEPHRLDYRSDLVVHLALLSRLSPGANSRG